LKDFLQTWLKCSPQQGDGQNPCCSCVSSMSRSQLKVKYQTIKYFTICRVCFVSPTLIEGFSSYLAQMFTSRPMLPMCQLKVKVTIEGQISNIIKYKTACHVRSVSPTQTERFSPNLAQMFTFSRGCAEPMLPVCQLNVKITIEGQISSTIKYKTACHVRSVSPTLTERFSSNLAQMFTSSSGMCRTHVAHVSA
jgi:hypothetical protein